MLVLSEQRGGELGRPVAASTTVVVDVASNLTERDVVTVRILGHHPVDLKATIG